jgi:hypothetical protein
MGRLVQGCINPIIKKQLIQGIESSCPRGAVDPLCTVFVDQLEELADCQSYREDRVKELQIPIQKANAPRPLTDYQKHMSVCLTRPGESFYGCIAKWKEGAKLSEEYVGVGVTKSKRL